MPQPPPPPLVVAETGYKIYYANLYNLHETFKLPVEEHLHII